MVLVYHEVKQHFRGVLVFPVVNALAGQAFETKQGGNYLSVEEVTERPVTQVVHQTSHGDIPYVVIVDGVVKDTLRQVLYLVALDLQHVVHLSLRQVTHSQGVAKSGVRSAGENVIKCSKLVKFLEPTEDRVVNVLPQV